MLRFRSVINVLLILCCLEWTEASTKATGQEPRIVGGVPARLQDAPYQASLRIRANDVPFGYGHFCGGSLITYKAVLSAAHCFYYESGNHYYKWSASSLSVVMGTLDRFQRTAQTFESLVQSYATHKKFNVSTLANDVGVIILSRSVPVNHAAVSPVSMASFMAPENTTCKISGWGTTSYNGNSSRVLLMASISILNRNRCSMVYTLDTGMICAGEWDGSRDACQGDSGGPLVCNNSLYGIVSWGFECAVRDHPGVYSSVPHYLSWILENNSCKLVTNFIVLLAPLLLLFKNYFFN